MNLERVTNIFACQEFEEYAWGCAGTVGNLINAAHIPLTSLYAYLLYAQKMTVWEAAGGAIIMLDLLFVPIVKIWRKKNMEDVDEPSERERLRKPPLEESPWDESKMPLFLSTESEP